MGGKCQPAWGCCSGQRSAHVPMSCSCTLASMTGRPSAGAAGLFCLLTTCPADHQDGHTEARTVDGARASGQSYDPSTSVTGTSFLPTGVLAARSGAAGG